LFREPQAHPLLAQLLLGKVDLKHSELHFARAARFRHDWVPTWRANSTRGENRRLAR
jgi:hypothetical protein